MTPNTVTLAGEQYSVSAPPLGKLLTLVKAIDVLAVDNVATESGYTAAVTIIKLGLSIKSPDAVERLEELPVTMPEMHAAVDVILQVSGLTQARVPAEGEAQAQQTAAQ